MGEYCLIPPYSVRVFEDICFPLVNGNRLAFIIVFVKLTEWHISIETASRQMVIATFLVTHLP